MENLKTRYSKDLEMIKQNMIDVYEVKTTHLTERKDELEIRQHKLDKQLQDRQAAYEELMVEYRQM
jgi:hypothetical protein